MSKGDAIIFGFSFGPIFETLRSSKKTRELWFGSYFFSYLSMLTIKKLKEKKYEIITPYIEEIETKVKISGFYPDQIIGYKFNITIEEAQKFFSQITDNLYDHLAKLINELCNTLKENSVKEILRSYIQVNSVCLPLDGFDFDEKSIVNYISNILFSSDLTRKYSLGISKNTCQRCRTLPSICELNVPFEDKLNLCPLCLLKINAHKLVEIQNLTGVSETQPFPPISAISTQDLENEFKDTYDKLLKGSKEDLLDVDFTKNNITYLKKYHKYIALIYFDADNLGIMINSGKVIPSQLSKELFVFSKESYSIIPNYGVYPIYIGGDDLLAFAPIYYKNNTVLDYIIELKNHYYKIIEKLYNLPSCSAVINIFYYKYPLNIALEETQNLLFREAKNIPGKNSLIVQITLHSGHQIKTYLSFTKITLIETFLRILKNILTMKKGSKYYPHSIYYSLAKYKHLILSATTIKEIDNLFDNIFNEPIHSKMSGISEIKTLLIENLTHNINGIRLLNSTEERVIGVDNFLNQLKILRFFED